MTGIRDAVTFTLMLLAAMWAENVPLLLVLVVAWVVQGHKKTAPRGANSESGKVDEKSSEKLSIHRDYTTV